MVNVLDDRLLFCILFFLKSDLFGSLLDELHLVDGDRTLAVDPLSLDDVLVFHLHDGGNGINTRICHKSESPRLLSPLVFENHAVFQHTKLRKVRSEL
jgi:hypothetical protein